MLMRHTILYLPAQILGPVAQFIGAVVWTHWLTAEAYGVLTFVLVAQELVFVVSLAWWSHFTLRYVGTFDDAERRRVYLHAEGFMLVVASFVQAAVALGALLMVDSALTVDLALAAVVFSVTRSLTTHLGERARADADIAVYTFAQTVGPVAGFLLAFFFVATLSRTPAAALFGFAVPQALALVWLWRRQGVTVEARAPERAMIVKALRFGAPLVVSGAIAWISGNGIRVIIQHLDSAEAMGLLSVGWGLGQRVAATVAMLVTAAAFPLAVREMHSGDHTRALQQLGSSGALLFGLLAPATAGLVVVAPQLTELIIAEPFRAATVAILPIAAIAGGLRNLRLHFAEQSLLLFERTDLSIVNNAVEAVLVIVGCVLGYRTGGLVGATGGVLVATGLGAIFSFIVARRLFGLILPFWRAAKISLATAVMVGVLIWSPWTAMLHGRPIVQLLAEIGVGALVYIMALALLNPGKSRSLAMAGAGFLSRRLAVG